MWSVGLLTLPVNGLVNNLDKILGVMICLLMGQELLEVDLVFCSPTSYRTLFQELFVCLLWCYIPLGFPPSEFYCYLFYFPCSLMLLRANESHSLGLAINRVWANPFIAAIKSSLNTIFFFSGILKFPIWFVETYLKRTSTAVELLGKS